MSPLRLMPLLFALVACGQSDALDSSQSSFYEPWVSGDVASGAASGEAPGTAGSPYDASQDGEGFVDGHRFEAFFFGEATVTPGSSLEGIGEFWAMRWDDEEEVILPTGIVEIDHVDDNLLEKIVAEVKDKESEKSRSLSSATKSEDTEKSGY